MTEQSPDFASFLASVASRLRHDLQGGLITLRMGLETLPDEEELKPLLIAKTRTLESLSEKLVILLRMGGRERQPARPAALGGEWRQRVAERYPGLDVEVVIESPDERLSVDAEAVLQALMELVENSHLAQARSVRLEIRSQPHVAFTLQDDGVGLLGEADPLRWTALGESGWGRSGLGLTIAQRCAQLHGGDLSFGPSPSGPGCLVTLAWGSDA